MNNIFQNTQGFKRLKNKDLRAEKRIIVTNSKNRKPNET